MILITGGAYQGQETYAKKIGKPQGMVADAVSADWETLLQADIILNLQGWVKRLLLEQADPYAKAEQLFRENPDAIYTTVELGSGIVPVDPFDREWRELAGRIGCIAAKQSEQVFRMVCGIATQIK